MFVALSGQQVPVAQRLVRACTAVFQDFAIFNRKLSSVAHACAGVASTVVSALV